MAEEISIRRSYKDAYPEYIKNSYKSVKKKKTRLHIREKMGKEFEKALHKRDLSK